MEKISVKGTALVDESDRERIFNGVNLCFKGKYNSETGKTDYFDNGWNEKMFSDLAVKGINLIRMGIFWAAIEPMPDEYDEAYLDMIEKYVDICKKYGIYVYLDMHQDCYCGMPEWATVTDSYKRRKPKIIWAEGYFFDKAVHRAFDNFWSNTTVCGMGILDRFEKMWLHVVMRFKNKENILGYDLLNEPFPGTSGGKAFKKMVISGVKTIMSKKVKKFEALKNIIKGNAAIEALKVIDDSEIFRQLVSGGDIFVKNFDVDKYYPFFKRISSAIRTIDKKTILISEACYYSNVSIPSSMPRLKYDDGTEENNLIFAPHGYDLTVDSVLTNTASNARVDTIFNQHKKTQERLNVPVIVGEWGGMVPGCDDYPHLEHLLEKFDSNKWSQTYWAFWDGLQHEKIMDIIARPYPVAVPQTIESYSFNRKNNKFKLKFSCGKATRKKAEIYSPKMPDDIAAKGKYTVKHIGDSDAVIISFPVYKGENEIEFEL